MSCPHATAPINIASNLIHGYCTLKCAYSFNYNRSSCVATNRGDYVSLSYDVGSASNVTFNTDRFAVQEVRLYTPSLHAYNGAKADAELVIVHVSDSGCKPLLVCLPVRAVSSASSSNASAQVLQAVVKTMQKAAPTEGEKTAVDVSKLDYNLTQFVPMKPFYSYAATEPYQPCSDYVSYVVFDMNTSNCQILTDSLNALRQLIRTNPYDVKAPDRNGNPHLYFNEKGPWSDHTGEIYIDCQPVGQSDDDIPAPPPIVSTDSGGCSKSAAQTRMALTVVGSVLLVGFVLLAIWNGFAYLVGDKSTMLNAMFRKPNMLKPIAQTNRAQSTESSLL